MADLEDKHQLPMKRMRGIEKDRTRESHKRLVWWNLWETESELDAKIERMIAEGRASADDEFLIYSWLREGEA